VNALGLLGIDHLEWWVGNARQCAGFLSAAFGFDIVAYAGPETGTADHVSYVLEQGGHHGVRFVVTGALSPDTMVAAHHRLHGDGVRDVALLVSSAHHAYDEALRRGATGVRPPTAIEDDHGKVVTASITTYGDTLHTFVERSAYSGVFMPGFDASPVRASTVGARVGLERIDHVVANVERGLLGKWVSFYERVLDMAQLTHIDDAQISTEYSALRSTVVWDGAPERRGAGSGRVKLPINEPADGRRKSQIEEYLDYYRSAGVQHVAMHTSDFVSSVRALRERGVRFLTVPPSYYDDAIRRMAGVAGGDALPWADLAELGILVDRDHDGYLLQLFTENVTDRPTVFFEIIERRGAQGFGEGNFKALFEAIEREQARRGNL
jgi:4-hydroxyphenylpyruvate dioxygenase